MHVNDVVAAFCAFFAILVPLATATPLQMQSPKSTSTSTPTVPTPTGTSKPITPNPTGTSTPKPAPKVVLYWESERGTTGFQVDVPGILTIPREVARAIHVVMIEQDKGLRAQCYMFGPDRRLLDKDPLSIKPDEYKRTEKGKAIPEVRYVRCYNVAGQTQTRPR